MQNIPDRIWQKASDSLISDVEAYLDALDPLERKFAEFRLREAMYDTIRTLFDATADDLRALAWDEGHRATETTNNPYKAIQ